MVGQIAAAGCKPFELVALGFLILLVLTAIFVNFIPGLVSPRFPYGDFPSRQNGH